MKFVVASVIALAAFASTAHGQNSASPFGPLTTNNGVSACVQFGSCTDGQSYATTETQNSPVKPPASSVAYAPATNAAESSASIANMALTGASAAYASRVAAGQGRNGAGNGATVPVDTASVIAGTAPGSVASTQAGGANVGVRIETNIGGAVWTVMMAVAAMAAGGVAVL